LGFAVWDLTYLEVHYSLRAGGLLKKMNIEHRTSNIEC